MILFIFEGERREQEIFRTIDNLFLGIDKESICCSFGNNIYQLYETIMSHNDIEIVSILKEWLIKRNDHSLDDYLVSDFSEIFLFFDYDPHSRDIPLNELNNRIIKMLELFDNETENGKLYINYPMIESIRYTKELPDYNFVKYEIEMEKCSTFKNEAATFSHYKNMDFILLRKKSNTDDKDRIKRNWEYLKEQNIKKANYICYKKNGVPTKKSDIETIKIFNSQLNNYINNHNSIAILNAFPIFLYDYLK